MSDSSHEKKRKILIVLSGESFRTGGQYSRIVGRDESYEGQISACKSHIRFFEYLVSNTSFEVDVMINTNSTKFNNDLIDVYKESVINGLYYTLYSHTGFPWPENRLVQVDTKPDISEDQKFNYVPVEYPNHSVAGFKESILRLRGGVFEYYSVMYLRIDCYLKKFFYDNFDIHTKKITFFFKETTGKWSKNPAFVHPKKKQPKYIITYRVADLMVYFRNTWPSLDTLYDFLDMFEKNKETAMDSSDASARHMSSGTDWEGFGFIVPEIYNPNTAAQSNPLYYIVNR